MQHPLTSTELACAQIAATASLSSSYNVGDGTINVYTGFDNVDKAAPAVICYAKNSTTPFDNSGIWHIKTDIVVKEMAITSSVQSVDTLFGDIHSAFCNKTIEGRLSNVVNNYYVYKVLYDSFAGTVEGDAWVNTLSIEIICGLSGSNN